MNALLLIHIPIIVSLVWAAYRAYNRGGKQDAIIIAACGSIVIVNAILRHYAFNGHELPCYIVFIQQILASLIVPFAYLYFAMQVNVRLVNTTSIILFSLIALLLFPNINVVVATTTVPTTATDSTLLQELTECKTFNIFTDNSILQYTIADLIIALQAIVTTIRIVPLFHKLRAYGLQPSNDVKVFTAWWCVAALFVAFSSFHSDTNHPDETINIICHLAFMVIMVGIFFLIGRGIDFHPTTSKCGDNSDAFAEKSKEMGQRLMILVAEKQIHIQPGYSVDNAIAELHTNRTYFYRMLKTEFGCTFSELMNRERVKHIKLLLINTDDSVSTIADRCGYKNTSYMIKMFKHSEGCTPNEWKRLNTMQQL